MNKAAAEIVSEQNKIFWLADDWRIFSNMGIKVYHPFVPLVYEDVTFQNATGNILHVQHNFFCNPINELGQIIVNQVKRFTCPQIFY